MNEPFTVIDDEPEIEEEITFVEWNFDYDEDEQEKEQEIFELETSAGKN